jgi:hypothetical protein
MPRELENPEAFFRAISPDDYARLGIDPQDVPVGTFAAHDHPTFLPSRAGGNAYGLGLIEQNSLNRADLDFLEGIDFQNLAQLRRQARQINSIYRKLGLLIRYTNAGIPYYLIPLNLVAHSIRDVKTKADEIERFVIQHILEARVERLDIGLMSAANDLMVHELTARFSSHRIFLFDTMAKLGTWRTTLDIVILPMDLYAYVLEQRLPWLTSRARSSSRRSFKNTVSYLLSKIHDSLEPDGCFILAANAPCPDSDQLHRVRFKSQPELHRFHLFTHVFKTRRSYPTGSSEHLVHQCDLYSYLHHFPYAESHLNRLLNQDQMEDLSLGQIAEMPFLNIRPQQHFPRDLQNHMEQALAIFFSVLDMFRKGPEGHRRYWSERVEIDPEVPGNLLFYAGKPRQSALTLPILEQQARKSGMMGCTLPLVAEYRDSFRYVIDVLKTLKQMRERSFPTLPELELNRLSNPFQTRRPHYPGFNAILRLMQQIPKLERICETLDPEQGGERMTPILENLPKLSLYGFVPAELLEILLIVVGHTTMSRVAFGKLPATTLKPITDKSIINHYGDIVDLLRVCRLMSMAEMAAALGKTLTREQAKELFRLYDDAVRVATDPHMSWDKLHDLNISTLGGVRNLALREMMKFFNVFEFLNNWQELENKGPHQREVLCDYDQSKLQKLSAVLTLSRIAEDFQKRFTEDPISRQPFFFRQFLNTEFHGTGHLFPQLGPQAGFVLLWVTVMAAERHIINFNPMLSRVPSDRLEARTDKIREALLRISVERLQREFFDEIRLALAETDNAFVFDTGLRLTNNPETRAIDVSFVDIDENLQHVEVLLSHLETQKFRGTSLKNLQDMERLFAELQSLHQVLQQKGCSPVCETSEDTSHKNGAIRHLEDRLRQVLLSQIFIPEEIHDALSALASHCPQILGFVMPEFHAFGNLVETWPTRQKQSLGAYVMRCLQKFQALITKDRNSFQDSNLLYQLAKQEFGALAEESIGASHAQLEMLEHLVDRIQERPMLYQVFMLTLLFQDIGKVAKYSQGLPAEDQYQKHAEQGAAILEQSGVLGKYHADPRVQQLVLQLIRYHGLIGHVIQGEEPVTVLEKITADRDERLLDAFVLHAILAAAAVEEGLLVADLLDLFLFFRARALEIIKSDSDWTTWLREVLRDKGRAILADELTEPGPGLLGIVIEDAMVASESLVDEIDDPALERGRRMAACERLFRLMNAHCVDCQDIQMAQLKIPVAFIYHKKRLKSIGPASFEKVLAQSLKILQAVASLAPETRRYLLFCLDPLGGRMRVYDFYPLTRFLDVEESLKLLLFAFQAFHRQYGADAHGGMVSFRGLSQHIVHRQADLQGMLRDLPSPDKLFQPELQRIMGAGSAGIVFQAGNVEQAIRVNFKYPVELDSMIEYLEHLWSHETLAKHYQLMTQELQKLPYYAHDYERRLQKAYRKQRKKVNEYFLRRLQERLVGVSDFMGYQEIRAELQASPAIADFTDDQRLLLEEMLEAKRTSVRNDYLDKLSRDIQGTASKEAVEEYWETIKTELQAYRMFVGIEYESLIAGLIDRKMASPPGHEV